jgi:hypothetical protein
MRRYAARGKRDAIEPACIALLQRAGWVTLRISVEHGPDTFAAKQQRTVGFEWKSGKAEKLREGQVKWHAAWPGEIAVIHSLDELQAWLRRTDADV